jgi:hypothetical protein
MQFSESVPQITPGTGLKTKAPRFFFFCWALFSPWPGKQLSKVNGCSTLTATTTFTNSDIRLHIADYGHLARTQRYKLLPSSAISGPEGKVAHPFENFIH